MTTDEIKCLLDEATPGPWVIGTDDDGTAVETDDGAMFVVTNTWSIARINGYAGPSDATPANARLIAAAPDLAVEVLRLRATLSAITATDCYSREEVTAMARAALEDVK